MFTADLMKRITIPCEVSFVKLASYQGVTSTGKVKEVIGITEDLTDRTIVIVGGHRGHGLDDATPPRNIGHETSKGNPHRHATGEAGEN